MTYRVLNSHHEASSLGALLLRRCRPDSTEGWGCCSSWWRRCWTLAALDMLQLRRLPQPINIAASWLTFSQMSGHPYFETPPLPHKGELNRVSLKNKRMWPDLRPGGLSVRPKDCPLLPRRFRGLRFSALRLSCVCSLLDRRRSLLTLPMRRRWISHSRQALV